jgi:DNA-directed RNA polymerase subunit beta
MWMHPASCCGTIHPRPVPTKPVTIYNLHKFVRSNQNTCFNQRPIVKKGQFVQAGEIIADGPATEQGRAGAWGKTSPWPSCPGGDTISRTPFSSASVGAGRRLYVRAHRRIRGRGPGHQARKRRITRDIPNVGEEALRNLDDSGIIRLGAEVKQGDILVGKITPKGETQLSPEEKLLRAIFGEKAGDVKDTSLRVPPGVEGIVIDAKIFSRRGVEKDDRTRPSKLLKWRPWRRTKTTKLKSSAESVRSQLEMLLDGQNVRQPLKKGKKSTWPKIPPSRREAWLRFRLPIWKGCFSMTLR